MTPSWLRNAIVTFKKIKNKEIVLSFRSEEERDRFINWLLEPLTQQKKKDIGLPIKKEYRFDTLIDIEGMRMAKGVCIGIAQTGCAPFNPIYIYGPSGCGKTHLLQATCFEAKQNNLSSVYLTGEAFLNLIIERRYNINGLIKELTEGVDVFCVDDIFFLENHPRTLERLKQMVNSLIRVKKPIIIAGHIPPEKISKSLRSIGEIVKKALKISITYLSRDERRTIIEKLSLKIDGSSSYKISDAEIGRCETIGDVLNLIYHRSETKEDDKGKLLFELLEYIDNLFGEEAPKEALSFYAIRNVLGLKQAKNFVLKAEKASYSGLSRKAKRFIERSEDNKKKFSSLVRFLEERCKYL